MATRRPIVLVSGVQSELPVGDNIDGSLYQGQQVVAGSGLVGGGLLQTDPRFDVALAANPSGLYFTGDNKLGFDGQGDNIQVIASGVDAVYRTVQDKGRDIVSVKDFGAVGDGTEATAAFQAAINYANGGSILVPSGTYRVATITAAKARLLGDGASASIIELATNGTETVFDVDELWISDLTISDRGRSSLDHTINSAVFLCDCTETFDARNCAFATDRSVLLQAASAQTGYTTVENCSVARVNTPVASEEDAMNIFTIGQVLNVRFTGLTVSELVARSVINCNLDHDTSNTKHDGIAIVEYCHFNYVHNSGGSQEVKAVFAQGYITKVDSCAFVDCFGRCIDVLGNYDTASSEGLTQAATVSNNKVTYTTTRAAATGSSNDEPGCVYLRYFSGLVIGNVLDFANLALTSNIYSAIHVRHGYNAVSILSNQVINAKAYGIAVDVSDSIATDNCVAFIAYNRVSSANANRAPIIASNDSTTKLFSSVVITDNSINYPHSDDIVLGGQIARSVTAAFDSVVVENNYSEIAQTYDRVLFRHFPKRLRAPMVSVAVSVDPAGQNLSGVTTSLTDAVRTWANAYECLAYTVQLANTVTTTQTLTGSTTLAPLSKTYTINGNNGVSGRIRFYADGSKQTNVSLVLNQNRAVFDGCIFNSDAGTSTTALTVLTGAGHAQFTDCEAQYGEYFVDSRGPDFSINGGTVDNIDLGSTGNRGIITVSSSNLVTCSIENTTGANNTRLANLLTPTLLIYENISLGTTTVVKSYTIAV